jgi:hypothetical protein
LDTHVCNTRREDRFRNRDLICSRRYRGLQQCGQSSRTVPHGVPNPWPSCLAKRNEPFPTTFSVFHRPSPAGGLPHSLRQLLYIHDSLLSHCDNMSASSDSDPDGKGPRIETRAEEAAGGAQKEPEKAGGAPGFFAWVGPALKTRRTLKTWLRCVLVVAGAMTLLVDHATLTTMGCVSSQSALIKH